jgi:hypothetical protein
MDIHFGEFFYFEVKSCYRNKLLTAGLLNAPFFNAIEEAMDATSNRSKFVTRNFQPAEQKP